MNRKKMRTTKKAVVKSSDNERERAQWELINALRGIKEVFRGGDSYLIHEQIQDSLTKVFEQEFVLL
jgi:hypothetical protein